MPYQALYVAEAKKKLKGKDLACWCRLDIMNGSMGILNDDLNNSHVLNSNS